jgi:hypothetical protein
MKLSEAYLKKQEEWKLEGKLEAAIGLLREGVAPQIISRALGLPIATIEKLRDQV